MKICPFKMRTQPTFLASPTAPPPPHFTSLQKHPFTYTQKYQPLLFSHSWNSSPLHSVAPHSLTTSLIVPPPYFPHSPSLCKVVQFHTQFSNCLLLFIFTVTSGLNSCKSLLPGIPTCSLSPHYSVSSIRLFMPKALNMVGAYNTLVDFTCCYLCL